MTAQPLEPSYLLHPDAADLESATTPIFSALFAEVDDVTRDLVLSAVADDHAEPVEVVSESIPALWEANLKALKDEAERGLAPGTKVTVKAVPTKPRTRKPATKKAAVKKAATKPSPLAAQEAKLASVRKTVTERMAEDFGPGMGGPK